jgi:hypothetical protein
MQSNLDCQSVSRRFTGPSACRVIPESNWSRRNKAVSVDLSFSRFDQSVRSAVLAPDLALLMVGVAARQASSPTARLQQRRPQPVLGDRLLMPAGGAFNAAMAASLARWKHE